MKQVVEASVLQGYFDHDPYRELSFLQQSQSPIEESELSKFQLESLDYLKEEILGELKISSRLDRPFTTNELQVYEYHIEHLFETAQALIETSELQSLNAKAQMTAHYTSRAVSINHTRLLHSVDVMVRATRIAIQVEIDPYEVVILGLSGLLHDIGHSAFSHCGEYALRARGKDVSEALGLTAPFDHEHNTHKKINSGAIRKILDLQQIDADDVIAILKGDRNTSSGCLSDIVDIADRHAYLARDIYSSFEDKIFIKNTIRKLHSYENKMQIVGEEKDRLVVIQDRMNALSVLELRTMLFTEFTYHPATLLANAVIEEGIHHALDSKDLLPQDIVNLRDDQLLRLFHPKYARLLRRTPRDTRGIEDKMKVISAWRLSDLNYTGRSYANSEAFRRDLSMKLKSLTGDQPLFIPRLPVHSKKITIHELNSLGEIETIPLECEFPTENVYVFFAIPKESSIDERSLRSTIAELMEPYLLPDSNRIEANILALPANRRSKRDQYSNIMLCA